METSAFRLGIIARADNTGLGIQTKGYYDHLKPVKTMVVDISMLEKDPARRMKQHPEWYPDGTFIYGFPNEFDIRSFLKGLDVVLIAESAYNMSLYRIAREMGVKTAVAYNYEFFDWFMGSMWHNDTPDLFIAPSTWHYGEVQNFCDQKNIKHVYLHCPVDTEKIKPRYIDSALTFVHIAGRPAAHDRNGTYTFLNALALAPNDLRGRVYIQDKNLATEIKQEFPSVDVRINSSNYIDMYKKGSVLVLPRKYGGNCLPMNEALAAGMPVIMSKVSPQTDFLPDHWLVEATKSDVQFAPRFPLDVYEVDPAALMLRMRWFKSLDDERMRDMSAVASELARRVSWKVMRPKYEEVLGALCQI